MFQIGVNVPNEYSWKPEGFVCVVANGLNGSRDLHLPSELLTTRCCAYPREIERTSHGKPMLK